MIRKKGRAHFTPLHTPTPIVVPHVKECGVTLGQVMTDVKFDEITGIPELLDLNDSQKLFSAMKILEYSALELRSARQIEALTTRRLSYGSTLTNSYRIFMR